MQKNIVHGNITAKGNVHVGDIINQVLPQSEPELTQEWFRNQVTLAVADLHERYSPKEHFDLPIARMFSGLARDDEFQSLVRNYFHEFLKETKENSDRLKRRTEVAAYLPILNNSRAAIREFYEKTKWQAGNPLDLSPLLAVLTNLIAATSKMEEELWQKRREIWQQQTPEKRKYDREPFSDELYYLRKIDTATDDFQAQMESEILQLAVNPCLLLHGKAGNGKSHLLGDTSSKRINQGLPAVLILGNKLISKSPVWQQILDEIGLNCSSESFLKHLNEAGRQAGTRALLMIDALNEGEGKNFWKNHLAGFIHEVRKYSFIGLVLTVRDTYLKSVVPQTIVDSPDVVKVEHRGFEGYELEAVKHFCHYFELEQPRFPILSPEFANPQLLLLLCKTLQKSGRKSLPEGLNGITAIYESYLEAVNITLAARLGYPEGNNLVRKGLEHLAVALAKAGANRLEYSEVERIFSSFNSEKGWDILQELLYQEGILAEDRISDYQTDSTRDVVRFGYERFGDFVIASHLLDTHVKKDTPATAFRGKGFFVDFFNPDNLYWRSGILEAVAVLLPERFGLEIVEVFTEKKMKSDDRRFEDEVVFAWLAGLIWRKKESIDLKKFMSLARKWVRYEEGVQ